MKAPIRLLVSALISVITFFVVLAVLSTILEPDADGRIVLTTWPAFVLFVSPILLGVAFFKVFRKHEQNATTFQDQKHAKKITKSKTAPDFVTEEKIDEAEETKLKAAQYNRLAKDIVPPPVVRPPVDIQKIIKEEEAWRRQQRGLTPIEDELARIDCMEGHAFERWCADLLRKNGFTNVEVTKGSGDQGVDVLAVKDGIRYAVQCKCYSSDLGNKPVQEVHAGKAMYHCQVGAVMTNRRFTPGAKALAEATGVLLWDREKLVEMLRAAQ